MLRPRACPDLPVVPWWKTNHNKITKHVEHYYNGKWDLYIDKWVQYRERLIQIHESGGIAIIKTKGVKLKGEFLKDHISKVDKRIRITQCLQRVTQDNLSLTITPKKLAWEQIMELPIFNIN